jgi:hypothetical protein
MNPVAQELSPHGRARDPEPFSGFGLVSLSSLNGLAVEFAFRYPGGLGVSVIHLATLSLGQEVRDILSQPQILD